MRKLWNRPTLPIWSVSTVDTAGQGNMNIATYVSAVSLNPKLMTIAVYKNTKTLENILATKQCLLQLLSFELAPVVRVCGKLSGNDIDKITRLKKRYELVELDGYWYFTKAAGIMQLELIDQHQVAGDHDLCTFSVTSHKNLVDSEILTTDTLRELGIIR